MARYNYVDFSNSFTIVDVEKLKSKVDGVILKLGFTGYGTNEPTISANFEKQYKILHDAGIPVGVYYFTLAHTDEMVKKETDFVLKNIKDKELLLPVYVDVETQNNSPSWMALSIANRTKYVANWCKTIQDAGYYVGVYASTSWFKSKLYDSTLKGYSHWVAQYYTECQYTGDTQIWQYSSQGVASDYGLQKGDNRLDLDYAYYDFPSIIKSRHLNHIDEVATNSSQKVEKPSESPKTEPKYSREKFVATAREYLGCVGGDAKHAEICNIYNNHKPLARGYAIKGAYGKPYIDAWCATFVSAIAIKCGYTDIIPTEVSCGKQIALLQKLGSWEERDDYVPKKSDLIYYYWEDSGVGEYDGSHASHVGIVEECDGKTITVIEGNYSNKCQRRKISVNGRYIRGFGVPKFDDEVASAPQKEFVSAPQIETIATVKIDYAKSLDKNLAGMYVTTLNNYNVRIGAGLTKAKVASLPINHVVKCYGYYTSILGVKWLLVETTYNGQVIRGFVISSYLQKK